MNTGAKRPLIPIHLPCSGDGECNVVSPSTLGAKTIRIRSSPSCIMTTRAGELLNFPLSLSQKDLAQI